MVVVVNELLDRPEDRQCDLGSKQQWDEQPQQMMTTEAEQYPHAGVDVH